MVTKLERSYKTTTSSVGPADTDTTTVSSIKTESSTVGNRAVANPSWDLQRSKWIEDARNRFDMDVQNMRKNMFALEVSILATFSYTLKTGHVLVSFFLPIKLQFL
ncbi:unnamed protein product [Dibothriocephalus latus]|uniref:Uncharacterized protein n=1 Tax=Dibothriocephalus latus TaxID=60516 RepID=A0A3P6TMW8_DIBLA|nr:unnamed protein product [Dibothriocephalus latus]